MNTRQIATAVVIHGAEDVRVQEHEVAALADGQALVEVELGGICGSDISYFRHGAVGDFKVVAPMVLGHEVIGRVRDVATGRTNLSDGSRVAVNPSSPCGRCERCQESRSNICLNPVFLGSASTTPHTHGGFVSLLPTRLDAAVVIEDQLDNSLAVFAEPLAVTVHAVRRSGGVRGANVLIVGAGPIGAMLATVCKAEGAAAVAVADVNADRLHTIHQLGIDDTALVGEQDAGSGFDLVFDASGSAIGIADALPRVRRGGKLILVGLPHGPTPLPIAASVTGEVDIVGSFRFNHNEFVEALDLLHAGLNLTPLISNRHDVSDAAAAMVEAASGTAMKVQLDFGALHHEH